MTHPKANSLISKSKSKSVRFRLWVQDTFLFFLINLNCLPKFSSLRKSVIQNPSPTLKKQYGVHGLPLVVEGK